jgi:nicotinamide riboside kinase
MKVLVTGTFCSGKTTLANELHDRIGGVSLIPDHCRDILSLFPRVDWSAPELRDYLIVRQLLTERQLCKSDTTTVIDAGIIGNLAHDRVLLTKHQDRAELIDRLQHDRYDLVFHCDYTEISLVEDGQRYTDTGLQEQINREISNVLDMLLYHNRIQITGSKEHRFATAANCILQFRNR